MRLRRFLMREPMAWVRIAASESPVVHFVRSRSLRRHLEEIKAGQCEWLRSESAPRSKAVRDTRRLCEAGEVATGKSSCRLPLAGSSIGRTPDFGSGGWRFEPSPASYKSPVQRLYVDGWRAPGGRCRSRALHPEAPRPGVDAKLAGDAALHVAITGILRPQPRPNRSSPRPRTGTRRACTADTRAGGPALEPVAA